MVWRDKKLANHDSNTRRFIAKRRRFRRIARNVGRTRKPPCKLGEVTEPEPLRSLQICKICKNSVKISFARLLPSTRQGAHFRRRSRGQTGQNQDNKTGFQEFSFLFGSIRGKVQYNVQYEGDRIARSPERIPHSPETGTVRHGRPKTKELSRELTEGRTQEDLLSISVPV